MNDITLLTAFAAGILSFLSPCVLPLLPGYISFISGETIESLTAGDKKAPRVKAVLGAVFFGIGFTLVFVILGAGATKAGQLLQEYKLVFGRVAGVVIIIFGLHMLGIFRLKFLMMQKKWNYNKKGGAPFFIEAFLLGVAFVFGWTPCLGPVIAAIFAMASQEETVRQGIVLLVSYGMGLWVPFLISAFMVGHIIGFMRRAGKIVVVVEKLSGLLLVAIGLLMVTDKLKYVSAYLVNMFPALGSINF